MLMRTDRGLGMLDMRMRRFLEWDRGRLLLCGEDEWSSRYVASLMTEGFGAPWMARAVAVSMIWSELPPRYIFRYTTDVRGMIFGRHRPMSFMYKYILFGLGVPLSHMKVIQRPLYIVHIFKIKIDHVGIIRFSPPPDNANPIHNASSQIIHIMQYMHNHTTACSPAQKPPPRSFVSQSSPSRPQNPSYSYPSFPCPANLASKL